jgi:hypothetical protein
VALVMILTFRGGGTKKEGDICSLSHHLCNISQILKFKLN